MMGNFKGTKGKWFPVEYAGKFIIQTGEYYADDDDILQCDDYPEEEVKANALLISKAPEMLEMLEKISTTLEMLNPPSKETALAWSEEINDLIKSATEL